VKRAVIVALVLLGSCVAPTEVPVLDVPPSPVASPAGAAPSVPANSHVFLVGEAEAAERDGCFGGDLAAYALPGGLLRRYAVPALSGGVVSLADAAVSYPTTQVEGGKWRTVIEKIDLRSAATILRIDASAGVFGNGLFDRPRCHTVIDVSADGTTLGLARPGVDGDPGRVRLDVFDARSGDLLTTGSFSARAGATADVSLRVLTRERIFLTLHSYSGCTGGSCSSSLGDEHFVLDGGRGLKTLDNTPFGCGRPQLGPGGVLVAHCGSGIRTFRPTGEALGTVAVPLSEREGVLGWRVANELVVLVTDRQVIRIDLAASRVKDARPIQQQRSLRLPLGPVVALAKRAPPRPAVQLATDGRVAYVVPWPASASWRPGISVIDLETASVRATFLGEREIFGIQLSGDGSRLFVLAGQSGDTVGGSDLVVLDGATGRTISTARLERAALALISAAP